MPKTLVINKDSKAWQDGFAAGLRDESALEAARTLNAQEFGNWLDGYSAAFDKLIGDLKDETGSSV